MKISILDAEKLIQVNDLKEITSSRLWGSNTKLYDPNGILSAEIFGMNQSERKSTFAYVSLGGYYIQPHIYEVIIKRMCRFMLYIINGQKRYRIVNGWPVEDPDGWTGITSLYKHWPEIDWRKSTSKNADAKKLLLSNSRDKVFTSKLIIVPVGYRDISASTAGDRSDYVPEINTMYQEILRLVSHSKQGGQLASRSYQPQARIQDLLGKVYLEFRGQISKKSGYIRKYLMGKTVIYGTRSVISAPSYNNETMGENIVDIEHAAVPISQCCASFKPFIVAWLKNFFQREIISNANIIAYYNPETRKELVGTVYQPEIQFSDAFADQLIMSYINNPTSRFTVINAVLSVTGQKTATVSTVMMLRGKRILSSSTETDLMRPLTVTDVLYLACTDACEKRHVMVSRYPIGTDKEIFISKIRVQSTTSKIHLVFNGVDYPYYPDIDLSISESVVGRSFIDTVTFSNSFLIGMGGDYDGDMTSLRGLWTDEANMEAERIMNQKASALTISGKGSRVVEKEVVNAFYELTRDVEDSKQLSATDVSTYVSMKPDQFTRSFLAKTVGDTVDGTSGNATKGTRQRTPNDRMAVPANALYPKQPTVSSSTLGRFIFNKVVLEGSGIIDRTGYFNEVMNKSGLSRIDSLVARLYLNDAITRSEYNVYVDRRDNLGYWLNGMLAHTISLRMAKPLKEIAAYKKELLKKYEKEIAEGDIVTMNMIETLLLERAKELLKDDPAMDLYLSGDLNFGNNYKNIAVMKGPVLNKITNEYDFVSTSLLEGIDPADIPAHSNSIVAGSYSTSIKTRSSGYLGKELLALLQMAQVDEAGTDCGTLHGVPITVTSTNVGYLTDTYQIQGSKLVLMTEDSLKASIGKTLIFRSPMTCLGTKFCSKCMGELVYKLGITDVGLYGVQLSHAQLNIWLKMKHDQTVNPISLDPSKIISDI